MTHLTDARGTRLTVGQTVAFVQYNSLGFGAVKKVGTNLVEVRPDITDPDYSTPMTPGHVVIVPAKGGAR